MTPSIQTSSRQAILVAGMHRSGTSALTRVFSLLGADLPENLAPALPDNNETGFWESVDLMVLHDKMLMSAGSSWDDWTPFSPVWGESAVGQQYKQQLAEVLRNDFAGSGLFAIKDPRICRFLPFWLSLLQENNINPAIVIPVRNPLEVAHSLKARDGFPLAKGGLLWLRHVLDAALFSVDHPVAVVSYAQLMTDWQSVTEQVVQQVRTVFPRQSVTAELEIEQYLDDRQKHNTYTLADVESCREFSPHVVAAYRIMLDWLSGEVEPGVCREKLQFIRKQFDQESLPYAKLVQAQQLAANKSQQDYEASLGERVEHYEKRLQDQVDHHALQLAEQKNAHAQKLAAGIHQLEQQSSDEQERLQQQITQQRQAADDSEHNWNMRYAELTREFSQAEQQLALLRKDFIGRCEIAEPGQNKATESDIQALFDGDWYLQQYPDLKDYPGSAFTHYSKKRLA